MAQKMTLKKQPTKEMLQKVTGPARQPSPPVPPAARPPAASPSAASPLLKPPPGSSVRGQLPLPVGKPVSIPVDVDLPGWDAESPFTQTDQISLTAASAEAIAEANIPRPPVDPRTPPLKVNTVHAEALPPGHERDQAVRKVHEATQQLDARLRQAAPQFRDPTIRNAHEFAQMHAAADDLDVYEKAKTESPRLAGELGRVVDAYKAPPPEATAAAPAPVVEAGAVSPPAYCEHCNWPRDVPDGVSVSRDDKLAFFACFLGGTPFTKAMPIFDGRVLVVFRTLTVREIDACYKQVLFEEKAGEVNGPMERYDRLNRYRLCLQIRQIVHGDKVLHDLPDGLDEKANPHAHVVWDVEDIDKTKETGLPTIEEHLLAKVITTENMHRVLTGAGNEFNRLVAKIEALTGSPDFLPETGAPS